MASRITAWMLAAALAMVALVPGMAAANETNGEPAIVDGKINLLEWDRTNEGWGVLRGAIVGFTFESFTVEDVDDTSPGGIVVRLIDTRQRTVAAVSLRERAFTDSSLTDRTKLTAPIDSVWGSWDYDADGYWTQANNQQINGGNCERIVAAEVTVQLTRDRDPVSATFGGVTGSCADIRG